MILRKKKKVPSLSRINSAVGGGICLAQGGPIPYGPPSCPEVIPEHRAWNVILSATWCDPPEFPPWIPQISLVSENTPRLALWTFLKSLFSSKYQGVFFFILEWKCFFKKKMCSQPNYNQSNQQKFKDVLTAKLLHFHFLCFDVKLSALLGFIEAVGKMCYKHLLQRDPREPDCKISHSRNLSMPVFGAILTFKLFSILPEAQGMGKHGENASEVSHGVSADYYSKDLYKYSNYLISLH